MPGRYSQRIVGGHEIARDLRLHEDVVRHVLVESVNHPVAIAKGVGDGVRVGGVQALVGIACDIEPEAPPALAIARGSQQPVHHLREGIRRFVGEERVDFFRGGRQAGQIERRSTDEDPAVCRACRLQSLRFQAGEDETIDIGARPPGILDLGDRLACEPAENSRTRAAPR